MGNYSILHQQISRNQKEVAKSMEEIKAIEKKKEQERNQKQFEKDLKIALKQELTQFFYSHFEKMQKQGFDLDKIYNNLLILNNRNEVIKEKAQNSFEYDFLNNIYKKTLKEIYQIFKDDEKAKEKLEPQKLDWNEIDIKCKETITHAVNTVYQGKKNPFTHPEKDITEKEIKKNGFILFLNMLLGGK